MELDQDTFSPDPFATETVLDAAPGDVWQVLTDPESMGEWLGAPVDLSVAPGAEGTIGGDQDDPTVVIVEEVEVGRRLVFRWASAGAEPTVVELDLQPEGRRTRLTIVERPLEPGRAVRAMASTRALALAA
jgi:uncharacterized protein YndB with AHSA1/START domain